jgi:hypothetical protein
MKQSATSHSPERRLDEARQAGVLELGNTLVTGIATPEAIVAADRSGNVVAPG